MQVKAIEKYIRMSPRKLRLVASQVSHLKPSQALEILPHVGKRAAGPLMKTIKSAIANAKQKGINEQDLIFKEIQINEGPRLKRGRPVARGRWHPYTRRMSHIRVILESKEPEVIKKVRKKAEKQKKEKTEPTKKKVFKKGDK